MKIGMLACYTEYEHKNLKYMEFSKSQTILEYDMLIVELEWLFEEYETFGKYNGVLKLDEYSSNKIVLDIKKRKTELLEFLNSGKIVVVLNGNDNYRYRDVGRKEYSGTGKNARVTNIVTDVHPTEILPIKIKPLKLEGNQVDPKNKKINDFYKKYADYFKYNTVYEDVEKAQSLFHIKNTEKVVSFFEKVGKGLLLFIPTLDYGALSKEKGQKLEKQYLDDIYKVSKLLLNNDEIILPEYSKKYFMLKENVMIKDIESDKEKLQKLQNNIKRKEEILKDVQMEKIIFTGTGTPLEKKVVNELKQIGFDILKYDENSVDEDIIISYKDKVAIVEVKGVDGSATEKHTSQTVKWKSIYHIEHDVMPKGFFIVNAFKNKKLEDRQDAFPQQMIKYATLQEICLLTTIQIFNIKHYLESNPNEKDDIINDLYSTNGVYEKFSEWNLNIETENNSNLNEGIK